jgi:hypothetical protein
MSLTMIFAYLLASGLCAETEFRAADGSRLTVLVCPVPPVEQAPSVLEKRI